VRRPAVTVIATTSEISAVAPAGKVGAVPVTVTGPNGASAATGAATFTYTTTVNPIVARIVYATVLGHGKKRTLSVRIRVNKPAMAQLMLLRRGVTRLRKTFPVKGGGNSLRPPLPPGLVKGTYQLRITLTDAGGNKRIYTASVLVPA